MKLKIASFIIANIALVVLHYAMFMSDAPMLWLATLVGHTLGLFFFPYEKVFTNKKTQQKTNENNQNEKCAGRD